MNVGEGATRCFWLEPTGTYRVGLRRFTFSLSNGEKEKPGHRDCPATDWGCDASVITDREEKVVWKKEQSGDSTYVVLPVVPKKLIPGHRSKLWPKVCDACGGTFVESDQWQAFHALGYVRSDTEEVVWIRNVRGPEWAGALYDNPVLHEWEKNWDGKKFVGPDGIALVAVCPNGVTWNVDGEATGGGYWSRTGDPRHPETLSVTPSIVAGDYHGWLGVNGTPPGHFSGHLG